MRHLTLSLAIHNHQPVGNFDHVMAEATDTAYAPMVTALERHPRIRLALHYSGPLLDWLRAHRADLLRRVRALVARNQVEILTGGYYEPILSIIPDADKRGQIEKLTRAVTEEFAYAAEGLWLAERVWEPHLARPLGEAGVRYTVVDDTHFHAVGLEDAHLLGYYVTEEEGVPLAVFPSLRRLRYLIPWVSVDEVIAYLRMLAEIDIQPEGRESSLDLALMGDDGEKFGMWPTTYTHCWERGWVEQFFEALEAAPWIEVVPPGEYLRTHEPAGRIYLPTGTYDEMAAWALPPDSGGRLARIRHDLETTGRTDIAPFVRGGFWRHFLVKYPEVNTLHQLALRAGRKVRAMPPGPERERALDELWAGECNCTYWHGVFGGVYLPHIRAAAFSHLIAAEAIADRLRNPGLYAEGEAADLDCDGRQEKLLTTDTAVVSVDPARGGSLIEWDDRPSCRNLGNVLTRRPEAYHAELRHLTGASSVGADEGTAESIRSAVRVREPGLERLLVYDRVRRAALRVHLLPPETTREQMWRDGQDEWGEFSTGSYAWTLERGAGTVRLLLTRGASIENGRVNIERSFEAAAGCRVLRHTTCLRWTGAGAFQAMLAEEWNLGVFGEPGSVWAEGAGLRLSLHEPGDLPPADQVQITETHSGFTVSLLPSPPAGAWSLPLFTISNSEGGYERNYQGVTLVLRWPVTLQPGGAWEQATRCEIGDMPR